MTLFLRGLITLCMASFASADLRMATQPRGGYFLRNQGTTRWHLGKELHARYMEPSHFNYYGLMKQKRRNYDNFLRSNIDNEQDNRNFNDEDGKDHLPFRTYETAIFGSYTYHVRAHRIKQLPRTLSLGRYLKPGESISVPLRWNNPHASEMEVNIWIFDHAASVSSLLQSDGEAATEEGMDGDEGMDEAIEGEGEDEGADEEGEVEAEDEEDAQSVMAESPVSGGSGGSGKRGSGGSGKKGSGGSGGSGKKGSGGSGKKGSGGSGPEPEPEPENPSASYKGKPIVIPIRKPSCSGEGHQDNIISFTIPQDFGTLGSKIPGFKGCTADSKPMCVLQIYSHSVESRTYAIGFPIAISGHDDSATTTKTTEIQKTSEDPWLDLSQLRDICLDATDPSATIQKAVPRWARLVSDVYNHAYQNSDYSPYSGQQHEGISRNMQASAINKMETGNRGELGKSILPRETSRTLRQLRRLEGKVYKTYEALANKIIKTLGDKMKTTGKVGNQPLANCFRCQEAGSTTTKRQETNTYIPSFQLAKDLISEAKKLVPTKYESLITNSGLVQIYVAAMNDLLPFFYKARHLGVMYQAGVEKSTITTMADTTNFKKRNENNDPDGGKYASIEAKKRFVAARGCPSSCLWMKRPSLLQEEDIGEDEVEGFGGSGGGSGGKRGSGGSGKKGSGGSGKKTGSGGSGKSGSGGSGKKRGSGGSGGSGKKGTTTTTTTLPPIPYSAMTASQSSVAYKGTAQKALAATPKTRWPGTCTHTKKELQTWWKVSLAGQWAITSVELTNRRGSADRLQNVDIFVGSTKCASGVYVGDGATKKVPCVATGSEIKIQHPWYQILTICGFKAYGTKVSAQAASDVTTKAAPYRIVKKNVECKSGDKNMGKFASVEACAKAVKGNGGSFFIYGINGKAGKCFQENTLSDTCAEGWEDDNYNFYAVPKDSEKQALDGLVYGKPCRGDDCKSEAECPAGQFVVKCEMEPSGDGIVPSETKCTAFGAHRRGTYRAVALCSKTQKTKVVASSTGYQKNTVVAAMCSDGHVPIFCTCYSPWRGCRGKLAFNAAHGAICETWVSRWGRGGKVYAICSKPAKGKSTYHAQSAGCTWNMHANKYSGGWGGTRSRYPLEIAKVKCMKIARCQAITCPKGSTTACTLRASSALRASRSGETTYTTSYSCANGFPEGAIEKPLVHGSFATNTAGECAKCVQFFGKLVHPLAEPPLTRLAKAIAENKDPWTAGVKIPPPNPDGDHADERTTALVQKHDHNKENSSRRRRRTALVQEGEKTKKRNKHSHKVNYVEELNFQVLDDVTRLPSMHH